MRKLYNISILISVLLVGFIACKKDRENTMTADTENEVYWSEEDVRTQNQILDFQNKIKNNSFKNGEMMSVDDVVWNIEALLNYNYSNPGQAYRKLTVDTSFSFDITVESGFVNYSDIVDAAFAMEEHIVNSFNLIQGDDKFLIATNIKLHDNGFKNGSKTLTLSSGYGSELIDNPALYTAFGENDFWAYGRGYTGDGGYCDGANQGLSLYDTTDAAEQIQFKINNPNQIEQMPHGCYYANIKDVTGPYWDSGYGDYSYYITDYPNPDDPIPNDGYCDYLSLRVNSYYECLEPYEMNFYLQGNLDIIEAERQKIILDMGVEYKFIYTDLFGLFFTGDGLTLITGESTYGELKVRVPHD